MGQTSERTQAEIRTRFDELGGAARYGRADDYYGSRRDALRSAMEYDTIADLTETPREDWPAPDVAATAREYLVYAIANAAGHRRIAAGRSIEKLGEWLWCLGAADLAKFNAAGYPSYGAPKLQVLAAAWRVDHQHASSPEWLRMCQGLPCRDLCTAGCAA